MVFEKMVFTSSTAEKIFRTNGKMLINFDLGKSTTKKEVFVEEKSVTINKIKIRKKEFEELKENRLYFIKDLGDGEGKVEPVQLFANETNLFYKLYPTRNWPTLVLSSVLMHRIKNAGPKEDTESKLRTIETIKGNCLDTCCGLGYTAIALANMRKVERVEVFERDKNVLAIAKYNPYSEDLFENKKILLHNESVFEGVKRLEGESFDRIIHDPPTVSFAKELYSLEFYEHLFRVLKKGGKLYHYAPHPGKTKGRMDYLGWMKNLTNVGFQKVKYVGKASGISAVKP